MKSEEFIRSIKIVVSDSTKNALLNNLTTPPGRKPEKDLVEISSWYNNLYLREKSFIYKIVELSVETSVFGFLCVLDGVRQIGNVGDKGELKLYFSKNDSMNLLNDHNEEYLHDIYNSL
jgi:hypothetical protein